MALITGGGRGIGRAIAFAFAQEGADVVVAARTLEQVEQVATELAGKSQSKVLPVMCDVSSVRSVEEMFEMITERFGRGPDIMVNNAGVAESAPISRTDDELWHRHIEINLSGSFYCTRACLPGMIERGWGRIINMASIAGKTGAPYIAAYSASKHGLIGLTRSCAAEVAAKGITVNAICPGYVDTEMTIRGVENITKKTGRSAAEAMESILKMSPQKRLVTSDEVAALALFLVSAEGRSINGQAISIDGGAVLA